MFNLIEIAYVTHKGFWSAQLNIVERPWQIFLATHLMILFTFIAFTTCCVPSSLSVIGKSYELQGITATLVSIPSKATLRAMRINTATNGITLPKYIHNGAQNSHTTSTICWVTSLYHFIDIRKFPPNCTCNFHCIQLSTKKHLNSYFIFVR